MSLISGFWLSSVVNKDEICGNFMYFYVFIIQLILRRWVMVFEDIGESREGNWPKNQEIYTFLNYMDTHWKNM